MEEDRLIKRKRHFRLISKVISYTIVSLLMIIACVLIFFAVTSKIAEKNGKNAPYGLYSIISTSMTPALNVNDVILVKNINADKLKVNDIITFYSENAFFGNTPITHRIVKIINDNNEKLFIVKGDANESIDEEKVKEKNIIGKVILKLPKLGKLKYFLASKKGWFLAIILPIVLVIGYDTFKLYKLIMLRKKLVKLSIEENIKLP